MSIVLPPQAAAKALPPRQYVQPCLDVTTDWESLHNKHSHAEAWQAAAARG
jgi:hypothetical protein